MLRRGRVIASRYGLGPGKMDQSLAVFVDSLSQYACSATIPVTASALASNPSAAKKYSLQGLELAIHGLYHLDYSLISLEQQINHFHQAREIFNKLGAPATGFRCPYLRWNVNTLTALKEVGFIYDGSQALAWDVIGGVSTDAYRRVLEFYGAQSANVYPALPGWSDSLIRIPYCLPDDEALVDRLHLTDPDAMAEIWLAILESTYQSGELFTLGLHPERISLCQIALRVVLEKARSLTPSVWTARLGEIAGWYVALGKATIKYHLEGDNLYHITIAAPVGATILVRSLKAMTVTQPWMEGYQTITENEFTVQSNRRPWIGLSPSAPASLERFLRHQGYLVETNSEPETHTFYLDRSAFNQQDERPLLADLERKNLPLVRLSSWPAGARSGLAITGDLDAFTIWDYGRRIFKR